MHDIDVYKIFILILLIKCIIFIIHYTHTICILCNISITLYYYSSGSNFYFFKLHHQQLDMYTFFVSLSVNVTICGNSILFNVLLNLVLINILYISYVTV